MEHLRSLIPKVLNNRGLKRHADAALVCWKADEWMQTHLVTSAKFLKASKFSETELSIESENSLAAQECQGASVDLLSFVKKECSGVEICSIRVLRQK